MMYMKTIEAIFLDMDGTVYSHTTNRIPPSALRAVEAARKKGILVFVATGRNLWELRQMGIADFPCDGWITMNGSYCFNDQGVYYKNPIDSGDIAVLIEELEKTPFPVIFCEGDDMFINYADEEMKKSLEAIHTGLAEPRDIHNAVQREIFQLIPYAREGVWRHVEERLSHVKCIRWTELAVDVCPADSGKDIGVRKTCEYYGIDLSRTLAAGDGPNDMDLFRACAFKAAMGNGAELLKREADFISDDIDQDGLYRIVEEYGCL